MQLNLFGSQEKGLSVAINNQESINCYVMPSPRSRNNIVLVGSMGSALFSSVSGRARGCIECNDVAYFVFGSALYSVSIVGVATNLGTVPGSGRVSMAHDGTSVIVVNGTATGYYYNTSTATLSSVTLPYVAHTVAMLDTYAVFSSDGQRFFISTVGDTDAFDALDFASAIKSPDNLLCVAEDHSEIILFGEKTIEPWFNSGDVDFPFSQNTAGIVERGLYARFSVSKEDNTLFFLGDDLVVYRMQGYNPIRVSTDAIEIEFSNLVRDGYAANIADAYAFTYAEHGHKFYQLTVPNHFTLVHNVATKEWHKLEHWDYNTHHSACYMFCYGKHLIGGIDGNVYELSRSYYDDAGTTLKRLRRSNFYSIEDRLINWKKVKFIFDFGTTPVLSGQGSDPKVVVRWSYDSGRTWRNERMLSLGVAGDYLAKAIARTLGASRNRLFEFYVTDPVPFYLIDAHAEIF